MENTLGFESRALAHISYVNDRNENMTMTKADLRDEIISRLSANYTLVQIAYDDCLSDKQIGFLLANDMEALFESFEEWESDQRWESVASIIAELLEESIHYWRRLDEDGTDFDDLINDFDNSDEWDTVRNKIWELDTSDWVKDLAHNSGSVLLRIPIDQLDEDHAFSFEEVDPAEVLKRLGFEATEENLSEVTAMLAECSPEFSVLMGYWIVGANVGDLYDLVGSDATEVEITNPYLYMGNPFAGSGWITENALIGTTRVKREDLRPDKEAFGYSVNEVFGGLSPSDFEAEIKAVPSPDND